MADETKGLFIEDSEGNSDTFEVEVDIDPTTVDTTGLFEEKLDSDGDKESKENTVESDEEKQNDETVTGDAPLNVPAPEAKKEEGVDGDLVEEYVKEASEAAASDMTVDEAMALITAQNKEGYSPSQIYVSLERLVNLDEDTTLENLRDDQRETVEDTEISNCKIDFFALTDDIATLTFTFDSEKDVYLREFYETLKRYRYMLEKLEQEERDDIMPMLTIMITPEESYGQAILACSFPVSYFRTLDDTGINASLSILFHTANITYMFVPATEEEHRETVANAMREIEAGGNGNLFED